MIQEEVARRADEALRRALSTPPKQHKDMKKGTRRKKPESDDTTAPGDGKRA